MAKLEAPPSNVPLTKWNGLGMPVVPPPPPPPTPPAPQQVTRAEARAEADWLDRWHAWLDRREGPALVMLRFNSWCLLVLAILFAWMWLSSNPIAW